MSVSWKSSEGLYKWVVIEEEKVYVQSCALVDPFPVVLEGFWFQWFFDHSFQIERFVLMKRKF